MAPFKAGASLWDLLREKRVPWEIKGQGNARKSFAKKRVAFDAINMTCAGGRVPVDDWEELRKNLGKRILGITLLGAIPVLIIDGRRTAPGAGKFARAEDRARTQVGARVPTKDLEAFYDREAIWWDRDALGRGGFRRLRQNIAADGRAFGCPVVEIHQGEAESVCALFSRPQKVGRRDDPACVHNCAVSDQDFFAYDGDNALRLMWDRKNHELTWFELIQRQELLTGLGFATVGSLGALVFLLGANDMDPPVEKIMPASARASAAKRACERATRDGATAADKSAWGAIRKKRLKAALEALSFVHRLAAKAPGAGFVDGLAVLRHLAARDENDEDVCSAADYDTYVVKLLGAPRVGGRRSFERKVIAKLLEKYEEEMRNGAPRAACGVGADERAHRELRNRVRAAAFPRGILEAKDAPAAYEWANRQFGGDLLPPKGHADYNKTLAKFQYVRRLYKK